MNAVPASVVLSVVVFVALMTVGRWLLVNETSTDRLINRTWSWDVAAILLYQAAVELHRPDLGRSLYLGAALMGIASFYGMARLLDGADPGSARRRQRRYDSISAVVAISLILGTLVVRGAFGIDYTEAVWMLSAVPAAFCGFHLGRACIRELRAEGSPTRERLTYAALFAFSIYWSASFAIMIGRAVAGTPPSESGTAAAVVAYLIQSVLTLLTAIPLVTVLLARTGWDRTGRTCRRLRPLWRDLTAAVPEVVLRDDRLTPLDPDSRQYRMTVEIWDALLHLKPYVSESASPVAIESDVHGYARQLARAVRAKRAGNAPAAAFPARGAVLEPRDREGELRYLLELAHEWPKAVAALGYESITPHAAAIAAVSQ
ncbi:hypothetical protein IU459_09060 [Nocardia amamiensis]|uniref:DUF6545 domain-containing protein n=1 Tax=Nocardia amamiensis TaxID=404578 RepID=A0ABS0CPF7_9NOCA|nr:MAB_1171c family putative transporter [Nocardia amamiensis]MBF6297692.1 hypothetical protein [Nocardia amamiensis]